MPRAIEPMKAVLVDDPFDRSGWIFEDKYDGIRAIAYVEDGEVTLYSRNQKEMTARYPELLKLPQWIRAKQAILDGEIIVVNRRGSASFQDLQARFGVTDKNTIERLVKTQKIIYYVFDVLYLNGYSLMDAKLLDRKRVLEQIIKEQPEFKYAPHTLDKGIKRFKEAERKHLEGIIAKNGESKYVQKRSTEWLKIKTSMRQEAVIIGYSQPQGSREYFGALLLALYDGHRLVSAGKVGTGFDRKRLKEIYEAMKPYKVKESPLPEFQARRVYDVQWLKPKLVCEVKFTELTGEGSFRHPVFVGLRYDKKPQECTFEPRRSAKEAVKTAEREETSLRKLIARKRV